MLVASRKQFPSPASIMREPLLLRVGDLCPMPDHFWAVIPTKWGSCAAIWTYHEPVADFAQKPTGARLCRIIPPGLSPTELRHAVTARSPQCLEVFGDAHGGFHTELVPEWFGELVRFLQTYYANTLRDLSEITTLEHWTYWEPRLDWSQIAPFARQVLEACARTHRGTVKTYGQIAREIGKPRASRAVGAALGSNPWPVIIPCHRVVGSTGRLTGFSAPGGVHTKRRMLDMEAAKA